MNFAGCCTNELEFGVCRNCKKHSIQSLQTVWKKCQCLLVLLVAGVLQTMVSIFTALIIGIIFLQLDLSFEGIQNRSSRHIVFLTDAVGLCFIICRCKKMFSSQLLEEGRTIVYTHTSSENDKIGCIGVWHERSDTLFFLYASELGLMS